VGLRGHHPQHGDALGGNLQPMLAQEPDFVAPSRPRMGGSTGEATPNWLRHHRNSTEIPDAVKDQIASADPRFG
jgi:hypothetical protein